MDRLLSIEEISQALHRSKSSLVRDRAQGNGPAFVRLPSGQIRYPESSVCKWVEETQYKEQPDMFDLFGTQHNRYARRNAGNALKSELEAVSGSKQAKGAEGIPSLANLFSGLVALPVRKPVAENQQKTDSDIGRNMMGLLPVSMTRITKVECRGETCTVRKKCA